MGVPGKVSARPVRGTSPHPTLPSHPVPPMATPTCEYIKDNGETCDADFGLCPECDHCFTHCEHRADERAEAKAKGGRAAAAAKREKAGGPVRVTELPPLETIDDCRAWFSLVPRLVVTDRISGKAAQEAIRGAGELRDTILRDQSEELRALRASLKELKADLKGMRARA